jgi:hypothetical protein
METSVEADRELRHAWYVAIVLMACNTLSFIDRQILGLLVTPIKLELGSATRRSACCRGWRSDLLHAARDSDGPHRRHEEPAQPGGRRASSSGA